MNLVLTECEIATHVSQNNLYFEVYLPHHTLLSSSVDDVILIAAWEGEESTLSRGGSRGGSLGSNEPPF